MKNLCLIVILLAALDCLATPTAICVLERSKSGERAEDPSVTTTEISEQTLSFEDRGNGLFVAEVNFTFRLAPNYFTQLRIEERVVQKQLQWNGKLATRHAATKKVMAQGFDEHHFKTDGGKFEFFVECDVYRSGAGSRSGEESLTEREKLRLKRIGRPTQFREYIDDHSKAELYDLWKQLSQLGTLEARLMNELSDRLKRNQFYPNPIHIADVYGMIGNFNLEQSSVPCRFAGSELNCDDESFDISMSFGGTIKAPSHTRESFVALSVEGRLFRNSKTREILGYSIQDVGLFVPPNDTFGGSSTSGGRIVGQQ